jgi:hypothetical protein
MGFGDVSHDGKAQARPTMAPAAGAVHPVETVEYPLECLGW